MNLKASLSLKISYQLFSTSEFLNKINWFLKQWERGGPNTVWKIKTVTWRFCIMFPKPVKQENTLFPRTFSHRVQDVKKNASLVEGPKKTITITIYLLKVSLIIKRGEGSQICQIKSLPSLYFECCLPAGCSKKNAC